MTLLACDPSGVTLLTPDLPPMGTQMRLKENYDISGFSQANQKILRAMKKYGLLVADTGSSMFISGQHHDNWNDSDLQNLSVLKVSDFEVVDTNQAVIPYPCSDQCPENWPLIY